MMTVNEVSKRTGVSIRTLQYYDKIGLLRAAGRTEAGYRLYDDAALERLQQILLFRELEFPLKDIQKIVENPAFDRQKALAQQARAHCTIRQAVFAPQERIPVQQALGRICAMPTVSCPPAIPIAVSGEEITPAALELMQRYGVTEVSVLRR